MAKKLLVKVANGAEPADLVITNAKVLDVFNGEFVKTCVAVKNGKIAGLGDYTDAKEIIDAKGQWLVPGFINAHCHIESSMIEPFAYCEMEALHGVTTIVADPHEVANVAGAKGIEYLLNATENARATCYIQLPSCVPATSFENAGAVLGKKELLKFLKHKRVLGLGEMMDYPGVLCCDEKVFGKLKAFKSHVIDGHAPGLCGKNLNAYAAAGIATDHESASWPEAHEKLRAGIAVLVRQGSASRNLEDIVKGLVKSGTKTNYMAFCSDDKHLADIKKEGTVKCCVKNAIALGLSPIDAYCMASINAAHIYRLHNLGAIAPGYKADMLLIKNLKSAQITHVFKAGVLLKDIKDTKKDVPDITNSVILPKLSESRFNLNPIKGGSYPVIGLINGQIITKKDSINKSQIEKALNNNQLLKVAVIERHKNTGNMAVGLLSGYGLKCGAVASTVGHDSHNLIVVGTCNKDMLFATKAVQQMQGGFAYVSGEKLLGKIPLPLFGLMARENPQQLIKQIEAFKRILAKQGVPPGIDPMVTLSFLALPVLPQIRITDMGIFDVMKFEFFK